MGIVDGRVLDLRSMIVSFAVPGCEFFSSELGLQVGIMDNRPNHYMDCHALDSFCKLTSDSHLPLSSHQS